MNGPAWLRSGWDVAFGVAIGVLLASALMAAWELVAAPPRGVPVLLVTPTSGRIWVHVVGAVMTPGVYALPSGSRVQDAIQAAGGLAPNADAQALNLAQPLQDGQRLWVPRKGEPTPTRLPSPTAQTRTPSSPQAIPRLNLNTATAEELETLPGIGPVLAQRIITYREENGPFRSVEELINVQGIGPVLLERLRPYLYVEAGP